MHFRKILKLGAALALALVTLAGCQSLETRQPEPTNAVIKPVNDNRSYDFKVLPNGLKVLVISDPDSDKGAAALDVHIGHLHDPKQREGLSHYLEHMLFLGTGKYPTVGEYGEFISKNGGGNNAGTGMEHTNYFFDINNEQLEPALDRFSRFFIDPLFDPQFVDKERNAVHSEYKLKVKDNWRRFNEAVKQTANQDHPMTQFSVGNLDTLSDTEDETIYDAVVNHYKTYYSAGIMSLTVIGNYPTETLMQWATEKFSQVPNNGYSGSDSRPEPYLESQTGVEIGVQTLENKRNLTLRFALPERIKHFDKKPVLYLTHMIGHEAKGTLYDLLKQKGYIKSLGTEIWGPDDFTRLGINIELTNKGYDNRDEIVTLFFKYIQFLKADGVLESIFNEKGKIANNEFEFQERFSASRTASFLSTNMQYYPAEHVLDNSRLYETFDAKLIRDFLAKVNPDNMRLIITAPDIKSDIKETRYDVAYRMDTIPERKLAMWRAPTEQSVFSLPSKNIYIAENLQLVKDRSVTTPVLGYQNKGIELWYTNENRFELPRAALTFRIYTPNVYDSEQAQVALELHTKIVADLVNSEGYNARLAGLQYRLSNTSRGYLVSINGFSEKLGALLNTLMGAYDVEQLTDTDFERIKLNLKQEYQNSKFAYPISQVFGEFRAEVYPHVVSVDNKLMALDALGLDEFRSIVIRLQSQVKIEGFLAGNVKPDDINALGEILSGHFSENLDASAKPKEQIVRLNDGDQFIRDVSVNHNDSTIVYSLQGPGKGLVSNAKVKMVRQILRQKFYKSLRTVQQYGYVVGAADQKFDDISALTFYIQSPKAHPVELKQKIDEFIQEHVSILEQLSAEEFEQHRNGLLSVIQEKDKNVQEKSRRLNRDVIDDNDAFNSRELLVEEVNKLTKDEVVNYFRTMIDPKTIRSIIAWNVGKAHADQSTSVSRPLCQQSKCIAKLAESK